MPEKGIIIVRRSKKGKLVYEIRIEGVKNPMAIPSNFEPLDETFNNRECQVVREKGLITKIFVEGKELSRKEGEVSIEKQRPLYEEKRRDDSGKKDLFDKESLKLPKDTRDCLSEINTINNFSFLLNHFIPWKNNKIVNDFLKEVESRSGDFFKSLSSSIKSRRDIFLKEIQKDYVTTQTFTAKVDWRMVVGLGAENVHETSMTLHHIYGIPYITGSALKGIARNAAVEELIGENEEPDVMDTLMDLPDISGLSKEKKREEIERVGKVRRQDKTEVSPTATTLSRIMAGWKEFQSAQKIFGRQEQAGKIIFLDAFPEGKLNIRLDIMNPHYPDYYGKGEPPADWQNPNPIAFLVVENTEFIFSLASKKENEDLLTLSEQWLKKGLIEQGIGAKTAVGYGYFKTE